ncbi:MAG: type IV pilin protein [Gammaproteobacteria bacterium]|nr:type IV pilin protein [Gammaproteobacteria bacterium]
MLHMTKKNIKNFRPAFTLIEMMIVIVIIAILVGIAYPNYSKQIQTSRRTDGRSALLDYAMKFEEFYGANYTYTGADTQYGLTTTPVTDGGFYKISASIPTTDTYILTATAIGAQLKDTACPNFSINQTGSRMPSTCW